MIDAEGFRLNVGIILSNGKGKVFMAKRIYQEAWQFPQGGLNPGETLEGALFRELKEEIGITKDVVKIVGCTKNWLRYKLPKKLIRDIEPICIGQKQKWYLLDFLGDDSQFFFNNSLKPEFDGWQWVNYWYPLRQVIAFKREVYRRALKELAPAFWRLSSKRNCSRPLQYVLDA
jgi:putative (di)nucleoside polyphosphate hydrolase